MRLADKLLLALSLTASPGAFAATITGNVTGPDGKPFMGAFVVAENAQNKMTMNVLSDAQGRYHIGNLPPAIYARLGAPAMQREGALEQPVGSAPLPVAPPSPMGSNAEPTLPSTG